MRHIETENYTTYTSELCHLLKSKGDMFFLQNILKYVDIDKLWKEGKKKHTLYTVAMIDFVSKENECTLKPELEKYRSFKMDVLSFPEGVETLIRITGNTLLMEHCLREAIPEFLRYNIVETDIRNVC